MAIFTVLLPEIWAIIHRYIVTPLDARSRVDLQRTCKAAYALDEGLILASQWLEVWNTETHGRSAILFECLKQMDRCRVFDWCPLPHKLKFLGWNERYPDASQGIFLEWTLREEKRDKDNRLVLPRVFYTLDYRLCNDNLFQMSLSVFIGEDYSYLKNFFTTCDSAIMEDLLVHYPRLFHELDVTNF